MTFINDTEFISVITKLLSTECTEVPSFGFSGKLHGISNECEFILQYGIIIQVYG